jgi:hypothetical protein
MYEVIEAPRVATQPRPGYFKRRLRPRSRDWVPGKIYEDIPFDPDTGEIMDRAVRLAAEFCGEPCDIQYVWWFKNEITQEEYQWLMMLDSIRKTPIPWEYWNPPGMRD